MDPINRKSIKIEADGSPHGVKVIDTETGRDFTRVVKSITWKAGADILPKAVITVICSSAEIFTEAEIVPGETLVQMSRRIQELEDHNKKLQEVINKHWREDGIE